VGEVWVEEAHIISFGPRCVFEEVKLHNQRLSSLRGRCYATDGVSKASRCQKPIEHAVRDDPSLSYAPRLALHHPRLPSGKIFRSFCVWFVSNRSNTTTFNCRPHYAMIVLTLGMNCGDGGFNPPSPTRNGPTATRA
jgi:hypothetical protein